MISWSVNNLLVSNILLALLVVVGVISWYSMPQEMFPTVAVDAAQISTRYPGAPPVEVEKQVTAPIEEALLDMEVVKTIESESNESFSNIVVKLKRGTDIDEFTSELRAEIDALKTIPEDAEETKVRQLKIRFPVISVSVYGDVEDEALIVAAAVVKQRLLEISGVAKVSIAGERDLELQVAVNPLLLAVQGVSIGEIVKTLRDNLGDRPGGSLKASGGDLQLRSMGSPMVVEALNDLPVRTNAKGAQLRLGEVADVSLRLEEADTLGRFGGKPALNLVVTKNADASTIEVAEQVRELVAESEGRMALGVSLGYHTDLSVYIKTRLDTVFTSGVIGLTLLLIALYLLLNMRIAVIAALGIPISFLLGVIAMHAFGFTINMVSMFAFLVALGMIVDDAIIVSENIYRHIEAGAPLRSAVVNGAREMVAPVTAAVLTTVAAFLPLLFIGGEIGAFVMVIPVVVSATLLGSLLEAFFMLPAHAEMAFKGSRSRSFEVSKLWKKLFSVYIKVLSVAMRFRYSVLIAALGVLLLAVVIAATRIPFQLFGKVEVDWFFVNVEAPNTYGLEQTQQLAEKMEYAVGQVFAGRENELDTVLTNLGLRFNDLNSVDLASNYAQMTISLSKREPETFVERYITPMVNFSYPADGTRKRETEEIIAEIRASFAAIPEIKRFVIRRPEAGPEGPDVEFGIVAKEKDLFPRAQEMVAFLREIPGLSDVSHNMEPGKLEFRYRLNERGRELGLTQKTVADFISAGYTGVEAAYLNKGDEKLLARVIFSSEARGDRYLLDNLPLVLPDQRSVYFSDVVDSEIDSGLGIIRRLDGKRMATVSAEVDTEVITALAVYDLLDKRYDAEFAADFDSELVYFGEKKDAVESFAGLYLASSVALFLVFFILVVLFRNLMCPLLVIATIPFAFIGVVFGHLLFGFNLQFVSLVGFVALIGIVVNDSLILMNEICKQLTKGLPRERAIIVSASKRVRPILLTTATTFLGVAPLIFFASGQTSFLSPMAVSLGFGLVFATALILVALPCFYLIADDLRSRFR